MAVTFRFLFSIWSETRPTFHEDDVGSGGLPDAMVDENASVYLKSRGLPEVKQEAREHDNDKETVPGLCTPLPLTN